MTASSEAAANGEEPDVRQPPPGCCARSPEQGRASLRQGTSAPIGWRFRIPLAPRNEPIGREDREL